MGDDKYILPRDASESIRLVAQHYLITQRQGYLLHPTITAHLKSLSSPTIADVATGNALLAFELANIPNAQVTGLDVSSAQYPLEKAWPDNCQLALYDVLQPVPDTLREMFDVVHVRFLIQAGPRIDKIVLIERFRSLLKPGGYLQWVECQWPPLLGTPSAIPSNTVPSKNRELFTIHPTSPLIDEAIGYSSNVRWFENFVATFEQAGGWQDVAQDDVPARKGLLAAETVLGDFSARSGVKTLLDTALVKDQELAERMKSVPELCDRLRAEGYLWILNLTVGVARKTT